MREKIKNLEEFRALQEKYIQARTSPCMRS